MDLLLIAVVAFMAVASIGLPMLLGLPITLTGFISLAPLYNLHTLYFNTLAVVLVIALIVYKMVKARRFAGALLGGTVALVAIVLVLASMLGAHPPWPPSLYPP